MKRYKLFYLAVLVLLILAVLAWITIHFSARRAARTGPGAVSDNAARVFTPDTSPPRFSRE